MSSHSSIPVFRRRSINAAHGRALEMVGHAIDYLIDELHAEGVLANFRSDRREAIEVLKSKSREIYFECPIKPSPIERCRALLRIFQSRP